MIEEAVWHQDGHTMHLELNRSEVVISSVSCPHTGACSHTDARCVVEWFLMNYGLECNVGVCPADAEIEIAWTLLGGSKDLDTGQVWVIPVDDVMYNAWAEAQRSG